VHPPSSQRVGTRDSLSPFPLTRKTPGAIRMSKKMPNYRGSFACVGTDNQMHTVEAKYGQGGVMEFTLDDGRSLTRILRGLYTTNYGDGDSLVLICDHPDAP
jgi:hypothetical protein